MSKALRSAGIAAGHYHAGRTKLARERAQQAFEAGRTRVLVATNAFGMGIDIPDIRLIVHFQAPGSVEAYYQEAGRAGREGEPARAAPPASIEALPADALELIVSAVDRLRRPVGKGNLAKALRGSRAKTLARGGLLTLPEYGKLAAYSEPSIVAAVNAMLAEGRLARMGRKYPTVWIPGKAVRAARNADDSEAAGSRAKARRSRRYGGRVARELDNYRRRRARALKWNTYMVFQRNVILAVDREQPDSHAALARIPGLGFAKIERFGDDILEIVRLHGDRSN